MGSHSVGTFAGAGIAVLFNAIEKNQRVKKLNARFEIIEAKTALHAAARLADELLSEEEHIPGYWDRRMDIGSIAQRNRCYWVICDSLNRGEITYEDAYQRTAQLNTAGNLGEMAHAAKGLFWFSIDPAFQYTYSALPWQVAAALREM